MLARLKSSFDNADPLRFFIITAFIFGPLFILVTPPFQTPDEPVHFLRAYQLSEGHFTTNPVRSGAVEGDYLPASLNKTIAQTSTHPIVKFLPNIKYDTQKTKQSVHIPLDENKTVFYSSTKIAQYSPVNYALSSTGIFIGKLFSLPAIFLLYIGRFLNLATWVVLFAFAIRLMPKKKWAAVFVGLLPMALFQAAGINADVVTTGLSAIFAAYVLRVLWQKQRLTPKHMVLLGIVGSLMVLSKPPMAVFLLLVLLIPSRQFLTPKQQVYKAYITKFLLLVIPLFVLEAWLALNQGGAISASDGANGSDAVAQIHFLLRSPESFINVLWNTYFFSWGDTITRSLVGDFGWADAPLAENIVIVGYIGLALTMLLNTDKQFKAWLTKYQKILVSIILLMYWAGISAALYAYYSPVGYKIIVGLQGRYLLPALIPLIALFHTKQLTTDVRTYKRIATMTPVFLLVCSFITIYFRYYIRNV